MLNQLKDLPGITNINEATQTAYGTYKGVNYHIANICGRFYGSGNKSVKLGAKAGKILFSGQIGSQPDPLTILNEILAGFELDTVVCNGLLRAIKCPGRNGGCGNTACWRITLDRQAKRIIADCINCGYRHSFPLDVDRLSNRYTGPIDETGKIVLRSWGRGVIDNAARKEAYQKTLDSPKNLTINKIIDRIDNNGT